MKVHLPRRSSFNLGWIGFIVMEAIGVGVLVLGVLFFCNKAESWNAGIVVTIILNVVFGLLFLGMFLVVQYCSFIHSGEDERQKS